MIRPLHRWAGLGAALILSVTALSGAALSLYPAAGALSAVPLPDISAGHLAATLQDSVPGLEEIRVSAAGGITAYAFQDGAALRWAVDGATGEILAPAKRSALQLWLTNLHRSLFLGDAGRLVVAAASLAMLALTLSGLALTARRLGGWSRLLAPARGPLSRRLHLDLARLGGAALTLSALTGIWLAAGTFGLLPETGLPGFVPGGAAEMSPSAMAALRDLPLADLRQLTFPRPGSAGDVFTLRTVAGTGYVDPASGQMLAWTARGWADRLGDLAMMLHTGRGAALLGLLLGLAALSVPVLGLTGLAQQAGRRTAGAAGRRVRAVAPEAADTILLVGSEGGTTWGFAERLRAALTHAGSSVHVGPMSGFAPERYLRAQRVLILAATSGDGDAPGSAQGFLDRVAALGVAPAAPFAVLGFGDSAFPAFCGYADKVRAAARAAGWAELMTPARVDRQSPQDFARWVRALADRLGIALDLLPASAGPEPVRLRLVSRRDYGAEVQAPTAILRFALPRRSLWQRLTGGGFGPFLAGDLLAVLPEGDSRPRYYSLASGSSDGFAEICVRKHPGGLCSGQLMDLAPGDSVAAVLRPNPAFHAGQDEAPLILIGAGTGIGPLAGFARGNRAQRPLHLYFGARAPESDLLFGEDLVEWQKDGRLASVATAFSRTADRAYVQDLLRRDADRVAALVSQGARIMVCGGRDMARGVAEALEDILDQAGPALVRLKAEGRYVEDVY
ncbi:N-acetylglucosamine transferase [Rhodovulum sulfidophilum]|uniref:NADPH--hemoprotein reductase n=1 Tax=Rhodovulum visakhapatnamense TaxID=364297 RepID=A0ABS1RJG2_9RHOB|nr:PepSY domain-containing protein [Rhodovulum visakhapatnamense]MBL3568594.1 PepSY domain-containing protein [Rhodovulum visakhapatnamense]MBL3579650.1 PepSY domain-containing protein [Rhodovulum visakhapatnamense]OLS43839.1 N-acetylglucosamine transferase [Rhodovulum sulfidophilum]